jgi:hypothetical protein
MSNMPKQIPHDTRKLLDDPVWLNEQHNVQHFSISELSKTLKVTPAVVRKAIRTHNIESPSQQTLRAASNKRKYGVSNTGALPEVRAKAQATMDAKYGGHNWSSGNREARDATCLEKYGNANVGKTNFAKEKARQTNQAMYGRDHVNQTHISADTFNKLRDPTWMHDQHQIQQKSLRQIASELGFGNDMTTVMRHLHSHNITTTHHVTSFGETQIASFIESLDISVIRNTRDVIKPKELDIYIPDHSIAIEYCGVYWHGESKGKTKHYHRDKFIACQDQGIQLLTIYDWEWETKQTQVKQKLQNMLGKSTDSVFARKCSVVEITHKEKKEFFNQHHVQGSGPGSINYGLTFEGELVAAMTFISTKKEFVLNRYATSTRVVGGFSKLLKHFQRNNKWDRIVSFADQRWSNGNVYKQTNFILEREIPVEYSYIINSEPLHKFAFRRKFLENKLAKFDPALSEWENMKAHGYDRIWDCGKLRFALTT